VRRLALPLLLVTVTAACATTRQATVPTTLRIEVLPALDRVPVTATDALLAVRPGADEATRRTTTMQVLGADLATALGARGAEVCLGNQSLGARGRPDAAELAAIGRGDDVDVVVLPELIAYGQVRRSWLWLLAAQGLLAGVGHGIVAARATGSAATGWWLGAGEFALETVTWVGGALVASRTIDPVIVRVWVVRTSDGALVGRWTREGTRPVRSWLRRRGISPRGERLRGVIGKIFTGLAPKVAAKLARGVATGKSARQGLPTRTAAN
jgi:hypothetical protein